MKARHSLHFLPLLVVTASFLNVSTAATLQYWNPVGSGGDGIWGTSPGDKNWNTVPGAPSGNTFWQDGPEDVAVFQDAIGGIVTVFDPVQTTGITQNGAAYTINAGIINLAPGSSATQPFVDVQNGPLTIDSILDGSDGLTKSGGENLILSGSNTYTGNTSIEAGMLTLDGSLASTSINISAGAILADNSGGLDNATMLTNAGSLDMGVADQVTSYISNGGSLNGPGTLTAGTALLNGGSVAGNLRGNITSTGNVSITGSIGGGPLDVATGTLTLNGLAQNAQVRIASPALLIDINGGLDTSAAVTNFGRLQLDAPEAITTYTSYAGTLTGPGPLSATNANLYAGSSIDGSLSSTSLIATGAVAIRGSATASDILITDGVLTNTGTFGSSTTHLHFGDAATLVADGTQSYALLTTSGTGPATWQGDLSNPTTIAPGGIGNTGTLAITGDFTNTTPGILKLDLATDKHDLLDVTGNAGFGGTLELNQLSVIAPFVPVQVVAAGSYTGNFSSISENLDGSAWFNPSNGTVIRMALPPAGNNTLFGANGNQGSTWIALYDDVIDPGITNITRNHGGNPAYNISSGIADTGNPDLLWALSNSFTPTGLNPALLNRLSPQVYGSFSEYAVQATRVHQRTALSAPPLAARKADPKSVKDGLSHDSKGGAKDAIPSPPAALDWEYFAAIDAFGLKTGRSRNSADYEMSGMGLTAGARTRIQKWQLAAYLSANAGSIEGSLIDADADGISFGLIGETLLDEKSRTCLSVGIAYGVYGFDGSRESVSATGTGWNPGRVRFNNVDSDSLELSIGLDSVIYQNKQTVLIPSAGLRYASSSMQSFTESTGGAAGAPIALKVDQDHYDSLTAELSLLARTEVNDQLAIWGQVGLNVGLFDDDRSLTARFAKGSRQMEARSNSLNDESLFIGWGAIYRVTGNVHVGLSYRADFRASTNDQHELSLSSSFRF